MKTRTDFVSNSSSSSFIIADRGFFEFFKITPADVDEALTELYGGKRKIAKQTKDEISRLGGELVACEQAGDMEMAKWCREKIAKVAADGPNLWTISGMSTPADKKKAYARWDKHFENWTAPNEGDMASWNAFLEALSAAEVHYEDVRTLKDFSGRRRRGRRMRQYVYDDESRFAERKLPPGSADFCLAIKKGLGIRSMKDVLHDEDTTMVIHFSDNEVLALKGMTEPGKADAEKPYAAPRDRAKALRSRYDSESYSPERFFEILIKKLAEMGKVDLSDPGWMDTWRVPEDHWWKNDPGMKNRKYLTEKDGTVTWRDVVNDALDYNAVMHEG